jgi:peptidoglycan/xylan/chitin deacetylase (PgdA/CDA1 family)
MPPFRVALYAATGAVLAMTARSVFVRPLPFGWALAALVTYCALLLGGVLVLEWRAYADALVRGPRGARGVALTFDDGPHPRWTPAVLDLLASRGVKATFFLVGRKVDDHPGVVRAIVDQGHAVGLHSHAHDRLFSLRGERRVREDLERGLASLERVTGQRPRLFRPPIGHTNPIIARVAEDLDLSIVGWSARGLDGLPGARPEEVAARIRKNLRDGAIILLHDAPERGDTEPPALQALPVVLDAIAAQGLEVVSLERWVGPHSAGAVGSTT